MSKSSKIEEIKKLIEEKKKQIEKFKSEYNSHNAKQLALKLILNGSYGAMANKYFVCFCNGVAGTVTWHGRDLIQTMNDDSDYYWYNIWHKDTELHEKLGVSNVKRIIPNDNSRFKLVGDLYLRKQSSTRAGNSVTCYGDTDSIFVSFKDAINSCDWKDDPLKFVHLINKYRLSDYFKQKLDNYADKYKVDNIQDFELEQVSKSVIYLEKKMYVKNVAWDDGSPDEENPEWCKNGNFYKAETEIQSKGIDLVRSSTPVFTREKVKDIIKYYFQNPVSMNDRELVKLVRELKNEFKLAPIESISGSSSCNNYDRQVLDDQGKIEVLKGTHHAVKAAALHNYLLNKNSKYKNKYDLIKNGQKVKLYQTTNPLNNEFAYIAGSYPYEVAEQYAPIDYDLQFEKSILGIINRFNKVLGLSELNSKLTFTLSIF